MEKDDFIWIPDGFVSMAKRSTVTRFQQPPYLSNSRYPGVVGYPKMARHDVRTSASTTLLMCMQYICPKSLSLINFKLISVGEKRLVT